MSARELITEHLDLWTGAVTKKSSSGRGSNGKVELTGIKKLRELILQLAVRGKLVEQDAGHEPVRTLRKRIAATKTKLIEAGALRKQKPSPTLEQDKVPFTAPETWEWVTFGEITFNRDAERIPLSVSDRRTRSGDFDYYGASGIIDKIDDYLFDSPLLLIGEDGANLLNRSTPIAFIARGKYWVNNHAHVIDGISENFLEYICLYVNATSLEPYVTGTAQPKMNQAKMNSIPVPLPPEEEQVRIVQKVDELMTLCDRLEQQTSDQLEAHENLVDTLLGTLTQSENATELADNWARLATHFDTLFTTEQSIDKLKQTILQLAVMGRLVEQDEGDESAKELITKLSAAKTSLIEDGKLKKSRKLPDISDEEACIRLPSGWLLTRLGDVYDVRDGTHDSPKYQTAGYPLITSKNLSSGELSFDDVKLISELDHQKIQERSRVRKGDILFAMIGSIGNPVIVNTNREFSIKNVALFKHYSDELSCPSFLKLFLENAAEDLKQQAAGGVQSFVSLGKLRSWLIPLPPLAEQHRIVQKVDELMTLCDQLKERLNQASETRCQLAEAVVENALN